MKTENPIKAGINAFNKATIQNWASFRGTTTEAAAVNIEEIKYGLATVGLFLIAWVNVLSNPAVSLMAATGAGFTLFKAINLSNKTTSLMQKARSTF